VATKKQQRRDRKRRIHGVEYSAPQIKRSVPSPRPEGTSSRRRGGRLRSTGRAPAGRAVRTPPTPSWTRAAKRAPLFALIMFAAIHWLLPNDGLSTTGQALQAVFFAIATIPLQYFADRMAYRVTQRRLAERR
jgi:hypothetical protein